MFDLQAKTQFFWRKGIANAENLKQLCNGCSAFDCPQLSSLLLVSLASEYIL